MKCVLGIDLGTSGNRVIAFSESGEILANAYREFPQIYPRPGWVEHDPNVIFETTMDALRTVSQQLSQVTISAIGLTNQRETVVVWDRRSGSPVYNAIVWQCRRTTARCEALQAHAPDVKARTGLFIDPYFSATKLSWILEHIPSGVQRAAAGELCFGTIDSWMLWKLTAGRVHATEPSNASRTLLFNLHNNAYDPELLDLFSVPECILPEVHDSNACHGLLDAEWLGYEIPIMAILGDQQASLFAHGGWRTGVVKNTYGTGLFLMAPTGHDIPESGNLINTVAWRIDDALTYAIEGSVFVGGAAVQWLRDGLGIIDDAAETETLARSLEGNDDVFFVPALSGMGAPHWDMNARGTIVGLTRQSTRAHFARATLEAIAYQSRDVIDEFRRILPATNFEELRVDGGACKNDFLMQFQADVLQRPVVRPRILESTALGSAGLAGITCGVWTQDQFLDMNRAECVFEPQVPASDVDALYARWQDAVARSLSWNRD